MNKGVDTLSLRYLLLSTLETKVLGFEYVKEFSTKDEDFKDILEKSSKDAHGLFYMENGFLFKVNRCFGKLLIQELHGGPLIGCFGVEKMCSILKDHYYWQTMPKDVEHYIKRCYTCQFAKSHLRPQGLYSPLLVPQGPWEDLSLYFITGLPRT